MRLLFATSNPHKLEEARAALKPYGIEVQACPAPKIEVQSGSLSVVAAYAAQLAYIAVGEPVVVEDAGLFIQALRGFPGPYSSYVYSTIGVKGILRLMQGVVDRSAYFLSAVAIALEDGVRVFTHRVRGRIAREPRGSGGFGFDPIFIPAGSSKTFAEMTIEEKNKYSHRAGAFRRLAEWLRNRAE